MLKDHLTKLLSCLFIILKTTITSLSQLCLLNSIQKTLKGVNRKCLKVKFLSQILQFLKRVNYKSVWHPNKKLKNEKSNSFCLNSNWSFLNSQSMETKIFGLPNQLDSQEGEESEYFRTWMRSLTTLSPLQLLMADNGFFKSTLKIL